MTTAEVLEKVRLRKACSLPQLRRHISRLSLRPISEVRQRPQLWPEDTAQKILDNLGLTQENGHDDGKNGRVVSLKKLRSTRAKSKARK